MLLVYALVNVLIVEYNSEIDSPSAVYYSPPSVNTGYRDPVSGILYRRLSDHARLWQTKPTADQTK
jgi:hypothetical protein